MSELAALLALAACYEAFGLGLLFAAVPRSSRLSTLELALLAFGCGIVGWGILAAQLALLDGVPALPGTAAIASIVLLVGGAIRNRRAHRVPAEGEALPLGTIDRLTLLGCASVVALTTWRFDRFPVGGWDGWAIWLLKARAIAESGGVGSPVFRGAAYAASHQDYPLLLPSLEAGELRAVGAGVGAVHLELALLLTGFAAALFVLLRPTCSPIVRMVVVLGLVASPVMLDRLSSNYADVPLAFFVTLGVVALGRWTVEGDSRLLALASLFLAAAALTKSEGTLFATTAFLAAFVQRPPVGRATVKVALAALCALAPVVPWRIFVAVHHLTDPDFALGRALSPSFLERRAGRLLPAYHSLITDLTTGWDVFWVGSLLALLLALRTRRLRAAGFAVTWALLSFAGLLGLYWISLLPIQQHLATSADRVVTSLVLGLSALSAVVLGEVAPALLARGAAVPARPPLGRWRLSS